MVFNSEKGMGWRASATEQDALVFKAVYPEAEELMRKNRVSLEDFADLFGGEKIAADYAYVAEKKRSSEAVASPLEKEAKRRAVIFEGVFHTGVNEHGWLGRDTRVVETSELDDWRNGVDGIVEFKGEGKTAEHLALGVDVTFSNQLGRKFKKIKDAITAGELGRVEYFRFGNFRGELRNVPHVVVGVDHEHLVDLARATFIRPKKAELARHPVQILQLREMVLELDTFAEYAKRIGNKDIAETLRRDEVLVREILQKKSATEGIRIGDWQDDKVFRAIQKELQAFV